MEINEKAKELLNDKKIEEANKSLGYNFYVEGPVMHGLENGRKINFPTLNMEIDENLLPNGVYISRTFIDGKVYKSMTNVGTHPSISELSKPIIETHVIDFSEFIYGKVVKVEVLKFIRDQKKFASLNDLKEQLKKDLIQAQNYN
jgi:riboflavin kinase/FMN adenylyltransferase